MRWSQTLIPTQKQDPSDAVIASHKLLVRAGFIRPLQAGCYTLLPLGLRALRKAEAIVRAEMDAAGCAEVLMPALQPAELWERTGRDVSYGENLLKLTDRHGRKNVLGPTHEEVVTTLVAGCVQSHKQLPLNLYQIQTKFRDEFRPRYGLLRVREFTMKDAYSFATDQATLDRAVPGDVRRLHADFRPVRGAGGRRGGRERPDRRLGQPRVHGPGRGRRGPDPALEHRHLRRQRREGRDRRPPVVARRRPDRRAAPRSRRPA